MPATEAPTSTPSLAAGSPDLSDDHESSVRKLQAAVRVRLIRRVNAQRHEAATAMQAAARGRFARNEQQATLQAREEIQGNIPGALARVSSSRAEFLADRHSDEGDKDRPPRRSIVARRVRESSSMIADDNGDDPRTLARVERGTTTATGSCTTAAGDAELRRSAASGVSSTSQEYAGKRVPVPDHLVSWSSEWPDYLPGSFTAAVVFANGPDKPDGDKWADRPDVWRLRRELEARLTYSMGPPPTSLAASVRFERRTGAPINPVGRTGLRGRGLLGKWGPNHAADPIVTRWEPLSGHVQAIRFGPESTARPSRCQSMPTYESRAPYPMPWRQVLAILRKDTSEWALPGGMVSPNESVSVTVRRSIESAGNFSDPAMKSEFTKLIDRLFENGTPVYMGYSDDPRNTDNAWMESKAICGLICPPKHGHTSAHEVVHFHCSHQLGALVPLTAGKGKGVKAGAVVWLDADADSEPRFADMYGSHRQWVEQAIAKAQLHEELDHTLEGMQGEKRVFAAESASIGNMQEAKTRCLLDRCVKKTISPTGQYANDNGAPIEVETFPILHKSYHELKHYGCNVAVTLLLRLHRELFVVLLLMFLLSLFSFVDNKQRNGLRSNCRALLSNTTMYDELTVDHQLYGLPPPSPESYAARCGYSGLAIWRNVSSRETSGILKLALERGLGTCFEYGDGTDTTKKFLFATTDVPALVPVPDSHFCCRSSTGFWLEMVCVGLFLAFLLRQRLICNVMAARNDAEVFSASDYAAMIEGLDLDASPEDEEEDVGLKTRLYRDLEALGFCRDEIDHIEIAVECSREAKCLRTLAKLRVEKQELQARRRKAAALSPERRVSQVVGSTTPPVPEPVPRWKLRRTSLPTDRDTGSDQTEASSPAVRHNSRRLTLDGLRQRHDEECEQKLIEKILRTEYTLQDILSSRQESTGHAFVVFQLEESRNRFVKKFSRPGVWKLITGFFSEVSRRLRGGPRQRRSPHSLVRHKSSFIGAGALLLESANYREVRVTVAPEPSDIEWENLHLKRAHRIRYATYTWVAAILVMLFSAFMLLFVTATEDDVGAKIIVERSQEEQPLLSVGVSMAATLVSATTNYMLKHVCTFLTRRERLETKTGYETALCVKLSLAYCVNTSAVPFLSYVFKAYRNNYLSISVREGMVNQDWFESGGLVSYVFFSLLTGALSDVLGAVRLKQLFNRIVRTRFATSQHKLNKLWKPPRMPVGRMYAYGIKDLSLCLIYGPIFPWAYLLAALRFLLTFGTTLCTITFFYGRPAVLSEKLMRIMQVIMTGIVVVGFVLKLLAYDHNFGRYPLICQSVVFVLYCICCIVYDAKAQGYNQLDVVDTDGVRYDSVSAEKGLELDRYECPKVRVQGGRAGRRFTNISESSQNAHQGLSVIIDESSLGAGFLAPSVVVKSNRKSRLSAAQSTASWRALPFWKSRVSSSPSSRRESPTVGRSESISQGSCSSRSPTQSISMRSGSEPLSRLYPITDSKVVPGPAISDQEVVPKANPTSTTASHFQISGTV